MKKGLIFKKAVVFLAVLSLFILGGCGSSEGNTENSKNTGLYPFESAIVEYAVSGSSEGNQTMYIKNGMTATEKHIKTENAGFEQFENTLTINTSEFIYVVDLDSKTGTKTRNSLWDKMKDMTYEEKVNLGKKLSAGLSASKEGNADEILKSLGKEDVAGKECEKYNPLGFGLVCIWNNVQLKTQINISGIETLIQATKVTEDAEISDDKFMIPEGVKLSEINI